LFLEFDADGKEIAAALAEGMIVGAGHQVTVADRSAVSRRPAQSNDVLTRPTAQRCASSYSLVASAVRRHVPAERPRVPGPGPAVRGALGEVRLAGGVRWQVLAPSRAYRGSTSDPNNSSLVLRLEVAGVSVLLSVDVEPEAQQDLLASGQALRANVLKVPHRNFLNASTRFVPG